jgi:hypothetical protein
LIDGRDNGRGSLSKRDLKQQAGAIPELRVNSPRRKSGGAGEMLQGRDGPASA